jgi:hypothetical protein
LAISPQLRPKLPLIAFDKIISSGLDSPFVVMSSILSKLKITHSCVGPAWSIGNRETIALAYGDEWDSS